jgi:hypothetical protein
MLPADAVKKLKGSDVEKRELFDFFVQKAITDTLEEWEGIMLESLKKELIKPAKQIVEMSANLHGSAGMVG